MTNEVRVRFAPSPTGLQHIGSIRTALFNYLFARKHGGRFILRIEDTDISRSDPRFERDLYEQLAWLGLAWDEGPDIGGPVGPYRQSERGGFYLQAIKQLLQQGDAYPCYCSPEELAEERRKALAQGRPPRYSGRCRTLEEREALRRLGRSPVYRFRVPEGREIAFEDLIRRRIAISTDDIGDFAIYTAQNEALEGGRALYNLAAVVDDHAMGITHVLRGEEHLSNTPRQILLYQALGYEPPRFGHLSLILTPDGSKMSKRFGDTSIAHYAREGYLPEALLAYIATLGWAPGRHAERLSLDELIERFDIRRLSANPSIFDPQRLLWFNKRRLQTLDRERLIALVRPRLEATYGRWEAADGTPYTPEAWLALLVEAAQEEAATLNDVVALSAFALAETPPPMTEEAQQALQDPFAPRVLAHALKTIVQENLATPQSANAYFTDLRRYWHEKAGLQSQQVLFPIRAALTGSLTGPSLGVIASLLGIDRCKQRLQDTLASLSSINQTEGNSEP